MIMLILPIKKKWYDMILSGWKEEEYREIKQYYTSRFINMMYGYSVKLQNEEIHMIHRFLRENRESTKEYEVMFRNGYSAKSPSFIAKVSLSIGTGKEEWGAEPGKEYYVLRILEVYDGDKILKNI